MLRERRDWLLVLISAKLRQGRLDVRDDKRELEALTWALDRLSPP